MIWMQFILENEMLTKGSNRKEWLLHAGRLFVGGLDV